MQIPLIHYFLFALFWLLTFCFIFAKQPCTPFSLDVVLTLPMKIYTILNKISLKKLLSYKNQNIWMSDLDTTFPSHAVTDAAAENISFMFCNYSYLFSFEVCRKYAESLTRHSWFEPMSARRGLGKPASRLTSLGELNWQCSLPE